MSRYLTRAGDTETGNRITRRQVLKTAVVVGAGAAGLGVAGLASAQAKRLVYPQVKIANVRDLKVGSPVEFRYPLAAQRNLLIDLGEAVEGGVGPRRSVVAYSQFCQHLGCKVEFKENQLVCPCHLSVYDPSRSGAVTKGPAPLGLPRVELAVDDVTGDIYAIGVSGLIFGYRNNLLDGERVG